MSPTNSKDPSSGTKPTWRGILSLPNELLLMCFAHISKADLRSVALANRQLNSVAEATLFSAIALPQPNLHRHYGKCIQGLLSGLLIKPGLRLPVRQLCIPHFEKVVPAETEFVGRSAVFNATIALRNWPATLWKDLREAKSVCNDRDLELVLLLSMLPNLTSLHLGMFKLTHQVDDFDWDNSFFGKLLDYAPLPLIPGGQQRVFSHLSSIHLDLSEDLIERNHLLHLFDLHIAPFFLRLPSLQTFHATGGRLKNVYGHWKCDTRASNVTRITLENCDLGTDALVAFVDSCSALKSFLCLRSRIIQNEPPSDVNWPVFVHALEHHKTSLEMLAINSYTMKKNMATPDAPQDIAVSSFRRLQALEYLDLDDEAIFGLIRQDHWRVPHRAHQTLSLSQLLPPNLEHLVIREARLRDTEWEGLRDWAHDCRTFGDVLLAHANLRIVDAVGFENPPWQKAFLIRKLPGLLIECNDLLDKERPAGNSTRLIKQAGNRSPVMEPPWLTHGTGISGEDPDDDSYDVDEQYIWEEM